MCVNSTASATLTFLGLVSGSVCLRNGNEILSKHCRAGEQISALEMKAGVTMSQKAEEERMINPESIRSVCKQDSCLRELCRGLVRTSWAGVLGGMNNTKCPVLYSQMPHLAEGKSDRHSVNGPVGPRNGRRTLCSPGSASRQMPVIHTPSHSWEFTQSGVRAIGPVLKSSKM